MVLGGALAGALKVGAVLAVTAGMGGGVYLIAQAGEGDSSNSNLQAPEATITDSSTLVPSATSVAGTPSAAATSTASPPGDSAPTASETDTSNWRTYESPLGVSIRYPAAWMVVAFDSSVHYVRIMNPRAQEEYERRTAEGIVEEEPGPGEAWIELGAGPPVYDAAGLIATCGGSAAETAFAGQPAVRCGSRIFWVRGPSGSVVQIAAPSVDQDATTVQLINSILATVQFVSAS
jgi:hypothetical protein